MEELFIALLVIGLGALYIYLRKESRKKFVKSQTVKKSEIIASYENQMREILVKYKDDESKRLEQKKKLLMKINQELSLNIFFDEVESKKLIAQLANLKA